MGTNVNSGLIRRYIKIGIYVEKSMIILSYNVMYCFIVGAFVLISLQLEHNAICLPKDSSLLYDTLQVNLDNATTQNDRKHMKRSRLSVGSIIGK